MKYFIAAFIFMCTATALLAQDTKKSAELIKKGWEFLVQDNDSAAITCFELAYEQATRQKDPEYTASALLHLGITYYGVSYTRGMEYCLQAMDEYKKLEQKDPQKALTGRSRCLQLLSTIASRQGKYSEAITLSREALAGFPVNDSSGYRGLIFTSLAKAYEKKGSLDSAEYYDRKALSEQLSARNFAYLPGTYVYVAAIELRKNNRELSASLYRRALHIADSTGNQQTRAMALLGLGNWHHKFGNKDSTLILYEQAQGVAEGLKDKLFYLKVLEELFSLKKQEGNFSSALFYREAINRVKDSMYSYDKNKLAKSLEIQFNVAEKDRKLVILEKEKDLSRAYNYLLWAAIAFICILSLSAIIFLRNTNKRNKQLLKTREELAASLEEQTKMREQYLQNELEFKESQLSAMALQMMQKNTLLEEIREKIEGKENTDEAQGLKKLITKEFNHDKDWADFNTSFESVNKNFYLKLREAYPDISANDLKICALIKLNLSIKEMAGILNISPDSVKTARYRLRKKLQLNTEDNLAGFISSL